MIFKNIKFYHSKITMYTVFPVIIVTQKVWLCGTVQASASTAQSWEGLDLLKWARHISGYLLAESPPASTYVF